jgi:hypothetical protein
MVLPVERGQAMRIDIKAVAEALYHFYLDWSMDHDRVPSVAMINEQLRERFPGITQEDINLARRIQDDFLETLTSANEHGTRH